MMREILFVHFLRRHRHRHTGTGTHMFNSACFSNTTYFIHHVLNVINYEIVIKFVELNREFNFNSAGRIYSLGFCER